MFEIYGHAFIEDGATTLTVYLCDEHPESGPVAYIGSIANRQHTIETACPVCAARVEAQEKAHG